MLLKDLQSLCSKTLDDVQSLDKLVVEVDKLAKVCSGDTEVKIINEQIYKHLLDRAIQLEYALLRGTLDRILNNNFSDDDKKSIEVIANFLKSTYSEDFMKYAHSR